MIGYWYWGQIIEIEQFCNVGILEHSGNWDLVSKSIKGLAKRTFT